MASTSSPLILTRVRRVATFVYGGTLFAVTKRLNDFLPVSYLLCMCWWQAEKRLYNTNGNPNIGCHAVSQGCFETPLGWFPRYVHTRDLCYDATRHTVAIFVMATNSDSAFCRQT